MARFHFTPDGPVPFTPKEEKDANLLEAEILALTPIRIAEAHRKQRNNLLTDTDWTQIPDNPLPDEAKALWVVYRDALRDITSHANWPHLDEADWPTKP